MYYKRIEKKDYFYINAPIALEKSYETMKSKKGVIVSSDDNGEFLLVPTQMVDEFVPTGSKNPSAKPASLIGVCKSVMLPLRAFPWFS